MLSRAAPANTRHLAGVPRRRPCRGVGYRLLTLPMAAVLRTRTLSEPRGFLKMLIAADSDEILGFTAFGAEASELMAAVQVAMMSRMPYPALRAAIFTHPTAAEGLTVLLAGTPECPTSFSDVARVVAAR